MAWLKNKLNGESKILISLFLLATLNLVIFYFLFGFHPNNDTDGYIFLNQFFRGLDVPLYPNRYLNPFYAVISAHVLFFLSPEGSLIATNIIFYFGLVLLTYGLVRRVFKNNFIGFVSALIIMTGYAILRYALTQVQDMGGYFWFLLTIYAGWRWWENKNKSWLYLSGVAVAFGVLTKESGCMGALFVGVLFLLNKDTWKNKILDLVRFSFLPFITIIINALRSHDVDFNSYDWFVLNWKRYAAENYTVFKWVGVHATTYNILWLFILVGLIYLIKNWKRLDRGIKVYLLGVFPSSLSYYAWSLFISRTVYISAWFFAPVAAYGIYNIYLRSKACQLLAVVSIIICLIVPYVLQSTLRYANLFKILDVCHKNPICAWNYFWANRQSFSVTGDRDYFEYK